MGKQWKQWETIFLGSRIIVDDDCSHEIKRCLLLGRKAMTNLRQHIKKQRHPFVDNDPYSQSCGFSSSHVQMWVLDHKKCWVPKNWCFPTLVLEKSLGSPLDSKIKPVNPKGNESWIIIGRTNAEAEAPILLPPDVRSPLEKTLMRGKMKIEGEGGNGGWNGWMSSLTQWTWIWANFGRQWRTGKPGVLQSMVVAKSQTWFKDWTVTTKSKENLT